MTLIPCAYFAALVTLLAGDAGVSAPAKSTQLLAPVVNGSRVAQPESDVPTSDEPVLRPSSDGSGDLQYDAPGFSARIAPDGSVRFKDKHFSVVNLLPWFPTAAPRNVPSVQGTFLGLLRNRKIPVADEGQPNDSRFLIIPLLTPFRPDPKEGCRTCNLELVPPVLNISARFDLTDEVMRLSSQDPYRYAKARFLVATRELRIRKTAQAHAENIRLAADELPPRLRQIACDSRRGRAERRQIIEKLRDELDGDTVEAHAATSTISQFLDTHFGPTDAGDPCAPPLPDSP